MNIYIIYNYICYIIISNYLVFLARPETMCGSVQEPVTITVKERCMAMDLQPFPDGL